MEYSIYHQNHKFYIVTNKDHKNFSVKFCFEENTDKNNWKDIIPGRNEVLIEGLDVFNDFLVVSERKNGLIQLQVRNLKEKTNHYIPFSDPTYVVGTSSNLVMNTTSLRYVYTSLVNSGTVFEYDMLSKKTKVLKQNEIVGGYNQDNYISERIWAEGRDGTKIPMSMVYKKGIKKDGSNPTLLYA